VTPGAEPAPGKRLGRCGHRRGVRPGHRCRDRLRPRAQRGQRHGDHPPERDVVGRSLVEVRHRRVLQCGEHEAAGTQRPGQRVPPAALDQIRAAGDDACLRPAEQLVAAERDDRRAVGDGLTRRRLAGQPRRRRPGQPRARGIDQPAADVGDDGHAQRRQLTHRRLLDEALDPVVAGMHLQHDRRVDTRAVDRSAVVVETRAVGRADVDEPGAGLLHHVGHPERAADLDALATTHRNVSTIGECGEHEEDGSGVVVDDDGRFCAAEPGEQLTDRSLARSPGAGLEVELDGLRGGILMVTHGRSAEVGVEQHAGGVDHRGEKGSAERLGSSSGRLDIVGVDRSSGDVDQDRVRKAGGRERPGEGIDRRGSPTLDRCTHRTDPTSCASPRWRERRPTPPRRGAWRGVPTRGRPASSRTGDPTRCGRAPGPNGRRGGAPSARLVR
jgi:hypothetical protein